MAKKLVAYYDIEYAGELAEKLKAAKPSFQKAIFMEELRNHLGNEGFLARQDIYVDALELALGDNHLQNMDTFRAVWGEELQQETGMFKIGWWLWPFGRYVERHGVKHPEASYDFLEGFTKRQTGEFAIRPLLMAFPNKTMDQMVEWSLHANVHVRRLSSEGMRIHLPWAKKTTQAVDSFEKYRRVLTNLKDDPSKFVQKSVGNNLNDLYKHDKKLADFIIDEWSKEELSKPAQWIIQHGRRGERKKLK